MMAGDLFEWSETQARDEAIAQVEDNSRTAIEVAYDDMVARLRSARMWEEFTSDTLLPDLERYRFSDGRAVGPLMLKLKKNGCIEPTNRMRESTRPGNHAVPRRIYRNLIGR